MSLMNEWRNPRFSRRTTIEPLEDRLLMAVDVGLQATAVSKELSAPVVATHANDGSGRIFVAEQTGIIRILDEGVLAPMPFLDIGGSGLDRIVTGGERGLLGLAFHPDFAVANATGTGKLYVYYSAPATQGGNHDSVISEFTVSDDPNVVDPNSERELLRFSQPFSNHNAGDLHFGPDDRLLYISSGDGGSGGDPLNNAQNLGSLLGKILRIDVDGNNAPGGQYGIPESNPFVGQTGTREEIFAYGLRNPFRFSFDDDASAEAVDRLFAGDVGQSALEEVDLITSGGNYGWPIREGTRPFRNDPDPGGLIGPIAEYPNDSTTDAVIGGFVYRGSRIPQLSGCYVFGDLTGRMFVLEESGDAFELSDATVNGGNSLGQPILAFGQDEAGELYVLTPSEILAIGVASWQNSANALDVSGDTFVSPLDVLQIVNELNDRQVIDSQGLLPEPFQSANEPPPFYDTNGDGFASPIDVLVIINFLNQAGANRLA